MVKKIKFKIGPTGEVALSVEGAEGNECEALSAPFEATLGLVTEKKLKDSYYELSQQSETVEGSES